MLFQGCSLTTPPSLQHPGKTPTTCIQLAICTQCGPHHHSVGALTGSSAVHQAAVYSLPTDDINMQTGRLSTESAE